MGLFQGLFRRPGRAAGAARGAASGRGTTRQAASEDKAHLIAFARGNSGVEAFVEPPTTVTATTVVLVASTGEWTRRRCPDARAAHELANELGIPSYDAAVVGYPQRMRDWNARRKVEERRAREA